MREIFKRYSIYFIFLFCAFIGCFVVFNLKSFAQPAFTVTSNYVNAGNTTYREWSFASTPSTRRFAFYNISNQSRYILCSNEGENLECDYWADNLANNGTADFWFDRWNTMFGGSYTFFGAHEPNYNWSFIYTEFTSFNFGGIPVFSDLEDLSYYLTTGNMPLLPFDDSLELDDLKVTSWALGTGQALFKSNFKVTWSDERISLVQVIISGNARRDSFESSLSPFKQNFEAGQYIMKKGDVIHITATPYKSDGSYGVSLYQSFVYDDNVPGSNIYRKLVNTPYSDNTITIPYTGVSGQPESVTLPVDGITTNNTYKVNYNPVTYEYGDLNLYEIYYSPVVIYPSDTPSEEIEETQDVINNSYTTNNYYETTKEINYNFDINFGDISGSDIQQGYDDTGNFLNGFGLFISKLSSWVLLLFPFLPPIVATAIVVIFGLVAFVAIIAFVLKICSVIADFIDAILPG